MAARLTTYVVVGIVAATLIAGLIAGAQRDDNDGPVDLIVHNAKVYTADADQSTAAAVAIRGNRILRVGSEREIARLRRPQTTMIDADGAAVLPGFNDAHVDFIEGGLALDRVDLREASTVDEIRQRIRRWADSNPDKPWVLGRGWSPSVFASGLPTRQLLDAIVADRPAHFLSDDGSLAWVNSTALKLGRIDRGTPNPKRGRIVRDPRNGEATGVLVRGAMPLVARLIPSPTEEERAAALRAAIAEAHRHGITSVQDMSGDPEDLDVYAKARRAGDLDVRVYSAVSLGDTDIEQELERLEAVGTRYPDDPIFKTGAVAIDLDGVDAADGPRASEPFSHVMAPGDDPVIDPDDLNRMIRMLDAAGWQVLAHAAEEHAVRLALNAYEHAARSNAMPIRGRRHRIEHVERVDEPDVARFGTLGVVASVQPYQEPAADAKPDARTRRAGLIRASRERSYDSIAGSRGRIAFGSGWPDAPMNPLLGLHAAVADATTGRPTRDGWQPEQRTALKAAIDAYTSGAAWASFDEGRKGTLAPGMLADLVVLSADIFEEPPSTLASATVAVTIFDGKIVYQKRDRRLTE